MKYLYYICGWLDLFSEGFDVFYLSSKGLVLKSELLFRSRQVNGDFVLAW